MEPSGTGRMTRHEAIGVFKSIGWDVRTMKRGDLVVMPFAYSEGECEFCREGLNTSCIQGGFFGGPGPLRAYIDEILPVVLEGRIEPGRVFNRVAGREDVPEGYLAMNDRESTRVMVQP